MSDAIFEILKDKECLILTKEWDGVTYIVNRGGEVFVEIARFPEEPTKADDLEFIREMYPTPTKEQELLVRILGGGK